MNVPANIKARVQTIVEQCVGKANLHFKKLYPVPPVHYDVKGTTGGYHQHGAVHFNPILLMQNLEDYLAHTVPHEVAHHIDTINGDNARPAQSFEAFSAALLTGRRPKRPKRSIHGPTWEHIMRVFGVKDITRCHQYDVTDAQVKVKKKFEYKCPSCSKQFFLTSVTHNRVMKGQVRFCPTCGRTEGRIVYVQSLGQRTYEEAKKVSAARKEGIKKFSELGPNLAKPLEIKPTKIVDGALEFTIGQRAKKIYEMYKVLGRQVCIRKMADIGIKETTASTYYQNFKAGR